MNTKMPSKAKLDVRQPTAATIEEWCEGAKRETSLCKLNEEEERVFTVVVTEVIKALEPPDLLRVLQRLVVDKKIDMRLMNSDQIEALFMSVMMTAVETVKARRWEKLLDAEKNPLIKMMEEATRV